MKNFDKKEWSSVLVVFLIVLIGEIIFWGKQGEPLVDTGREFYLAQQVIEGGVLYKDIFNIYGPLSYQLNALLFGLFGVHANVLYLVGNIVGMEIVLGIYRLLRLYQDRFTSVVIASFVAFAGIYKLYIFNYVLPYSFGMSYGLLAVICALILLIKYCRNGLAKYLYFSLFLSGAAVCLKYDYFCFMLVYVYAFFFIKKCNFREFLFALASFLSVPVISFGTLFLQGLTINDVLMNIELFDKIIKSPGLTVFYTKYGIYPSTGYIGMSLINLTIFGGLAFLFYKIFKIAKNKSLYSTLFIILAIGVFCAGAVVSFRKMFCFLPLLLLISGCIFYKKISDKSVFLPVLAALCISVKSFWFAPVAYYGVFYFALLISAGVILANNLFPKKERLIDTITALVLVGAIGTVLNLELHKLKNFGYKLNTPKGALYTKSQDVPYVLFLKLLEEKTKPTDKVVILPEGHMFNFLSGRKSDDFYSNLIPMYVEAFGDEKLIEHYSNNSPEYFVIAGRDTSEYGKQYFCKDYAQELCGWIFNNYHVMYKITGEPQFIVLRKN